MISRPRILFASSAFLLLALSSAALAQSANQFDDPSGMIQGQFVIGRMKIGTTFYFDTYGRRTASIMSAMGREKRSIVIGDTTIEWTQGESEAMRSVDHSSSPLISLLTDFTHMDAERKARLHYKELKPKKLLGQVASGFSVDSAGSTMSIWQWHSIPLLIEMKKGKEKASFTVSKLDVATPVPATAFQLPADVQIVGGDEAAEPQQEGLEGGGQ